MLLTMQREPSKNGATLSKLFNGTDFICDICEDVVREVSGQPVSAWKIFGETAIPAGVYQITFEPSARFGPNTLTVNDVDGFKGVRIHGGNTAANTEGCLLPGSRNSSCTVAASQDHLAILRSLIRESVDAGETVELEIMAALAEA